MTLSELENSLAMLRRQGVSEFIDNPGDKGFSVKFFPSSPEVSNEKQKDETMCRCGHFDYEHNAGLCLKGCEPSSCEAKE